ncbi:fumarate reductase cytochrome b subunit [Motiliproteus sp. SC1-56]|uniref:fumarate reductase cytochrome b subunit n=1 Tax=Motiliproteus sp. SC1-56 TaxID=2799565 RepID=UPI001A8F3E25|nr:fumarate reductase cytochrome b subunit [Motiliproteus sp. SC1-56]
MAEQRNYLRLLTWDPSGRRTAARLDLWQSLSGFLLALFLWAHLLLVSSILLGKEAMAWVTRAMEGAFLSPHGEGYPVIVSVIALAITLLVVVHALLAMRKLPSNWHQYRELRHSQQLLDHADTRQWSLQALTGVIILFLVPAHLFTMFALPETIGPEGSAMRIVAGGFWILYLPLLLVAELHGAIGLYRLAIKWNLFPSRDPRRTRLRLQRLKWAASGLFILLGLATLAVFVRIGLEQGGAL